MRRFAILPGLTAGLLVGTLVAAQLKRLSSAPLDPRPDSSRLDLERLSDAELETLALDALTKLSEKRGAAPSKGSAGREGTEQRQIYLGLENARRLLPLGKKLTLRALAAGLKTGGLSRERRLIASVRRIVFDAGLGNSAAVSEDDLATIRVGPGYAPYLTSDDEAILLLGHELTHVAARGGRLQHFFEGVSRVASQSAGPPLGQIQKEELACDFAGAEVLRRYIALRPTGRASAERFARAFGYESRSERLAHAWQDFCLSYNGDPDDEEHVSLAQTLRLLPRLNPELKSMIPEDATSSRLCR
ncbi:MAG: hypothetical protein ABW250_03215 [Pyrinomonadaceae bacterium]